MERRWIGGVCPNVNFIPSKNEIWRARVADLVHRADVFGAVTGTATNNMTQVRQRKRDMVDDLIEVHLRNSKESGAELVMGERTICGAKEGEDHGT